MEKDKIIKIVNFIMKIFWIFVLGSIFGFVVEMLYATIYTGKLVIRQGLVYGPFVQVYGMGAVAFYFLVRKFKEPKAVFFAGMLTGGVLEYLCSFFQEIFFGTISWDYSNFLLNLNGRICVLYCLYWGIIALVFLKIVYPWLKKIEPLMYKRSIRIFTVFLMLFMIFDITISILAVDRQQERKENIEPKNSLEVFLDKTYPDEFLDKIYNNKKNVE